MPLRPDLPSGLNLSRRATTPVKLPKMSFPLGSSSDQADPENEMAAQENAATAEKSMEFARRQEVEMEKPALPAITEATRVIVYGKAGCQACMDAIQDLIDRQMSFTYHDVARDAQARQQLQMICGSEAVVPVIVQIGYKGT